MRLILILLLTGITCSGQTKQEAVDYINYFYNQETWTGHEKGGFKYNSFNDTVEYKLETLLKSPYEEMPRMTGTTEVMFKISNIKKTTLSGEYYNNLFLPTFKIEFLSPVEFYSLVKEPGKMPEVIRRKDFEISFMIRRSITEEQFEDFKRAVAILLGK